MNLIPAHPFFNFDDLLDFWGSPRGIDTRADSFTPRVDVKDKDDHFEITAELPGVSKDDLNVTFSNGVLTIEAETKKEDKEEKDGKIIRQERRYGKFTRSFNLGTAIDEENISASFADGILRLDTPKTKPPEAEVRKISIQ
jgi:HSP20 family protein